MLINFQQASAQCSLACNGTTQVSLDANCEALITAEMILNDQASSCPSGSFMVTVSDNYGTIINSPTVTGDYAGQTLTASVMDMSGSGNSCWGYIIIEDKLGPIADCPTNPNILMDCADLSLYEGPDFIDNCNGILTPILVSENINVLCDPALTKRITRVYSAIDEDGRVSANTCEIIISLRRIRWDRIIYPDPYEKANGTHLDCSGMDWDTITTNGYPEPEEVGVVKYQVINLDGTIDVIDLFPIPDIYCNTVVTFDDTVLPLIGCTQKIMRRWTVREWHCDGEVKDDFTQIIEISDTEAPVLTCGGAIQVTTNTITGPTGSHYGNVTCGSSVVIPFPQATDNCSTDLSYDITYDGGFEKDYNGIDPIILPMGGTSLEFAVYDGCYNSSTCTVVVEVIDNTPPVAVCDQFTVVSLTSNGEAVVNATSFDDGSYDDCKDHCQLVRRMTPGSCSCKLPEFCDLRYIGANNGSHYYLSNYEISSTIAKNRAAAYGGTLCIFDDADEEAWVTTAVRQTYSDRFWIGIKRFGAGFLYDDHSALGYTNWGMGQPSNDPGEDCVMITPADTWNDAGCAGEWRYVLEIKDECGFSKIANFCCEDVGTEQMVVFRVVDVFGNFNDCMVNVEVQDKAAPSITCPPNRTVNCDVAYDLSTLFNSYGTATIGENCGVELIETQIDETNQCNIGDLTRIFTVTTSSGVQAVCKQILTFENNDPFDGSLIVCPRDTSIAGCSVPGDLGPDLLGRPTYPGDQCDLIGVDYEDEIFTFNNPNGSEACLKILRTWQIVNWCEMDPLTGLFKIWTCQQVIKITNGIKPVISGCDPKQICTYDSNCDSGFIDLEVTATDDCTLNENLAWRYEVYTGQLGLGPSSFAVPAVSKSGTGNIANASGKYPIGSHVVRWTFFDKCGNATTCDQAFTIVNCKAPTAYCINGLAVDLMPMDFDFDGITDFGMVELWASDFDAGSHHPCYDEVFLSFSADTSDRNMTFDCTTRGDQEVEIWVSVEGPEGILIQSFCSSFVNVQDNTGACVGQSDVVVEGSVYTELLENVLDVNVELEGSPLNVTTDFTGDYAFPNMPTGGNYVVNPSRNDNPLNGVSTFDLIMIQRHVLGIEALDSPYKMIAADANGDNSISTLDLIELRKLILGVYDALPNNTSWRFVDNGYQFQNPAAPFDEAFPENYDIQSLSSNMQIDFIAVKTGDVDNSVSLNANDKDIESRSQQNTELKFTNRLIEKDELVMIPFTVSESELNGFQFNLQYDKNILDVIGIEGLGLELFESNYRISKTGIKMSWNNANGLNIDGESFALIATAKKAGDLNNVFWIDSEDFKSEVYLRNGNRNAINIISENSDASTEFVLYQNTPNPFTLNTEVRFNIPTDSNVSIIVNDIDGRIVMNKNLHFNAGLNAHTIDSKELGSAGVYYLTLKTNEQTSTIKMVVLK